MTADARNDAQDAGRELIRRAFEQARAKGKDDWREMTTAVLKNRLLALTSGTFKEQDWGANSILEFAEEFPDIVAVDRSHPFPRVTYVEAKASSLSGRHDRGRRLRPDLWNALFDYSRGVPYVWRLPSGPAEARADMEETNDPVLPTLSEEELGDWRRAFAAAQTSDMGDDDRGRLEEWRRLGLPTKFLPSGLQGSWNLELRSRASDRLEGWFREHGLDLPPDLLIRPALQLHDPEADALRQLLHASIDRMTDDELRAVQLPAAVVLRVVEQRPARK
ncbi:MAG TPA: hypothetical protein VNF73_14700 [Candidatus Saccharimonadales bacterium]|nr:hypothetical protein [Chloroflexota bacterium]HVA87553.1 hypothetical protein [Candidatus Saccharimonadales bacterium]